MPPNDHPSLLNPSKLAALVERFRGNFSKIAAHLDRKRRHVSRDSVRRAVEKLNLKARADELALAHATSGKRRPRDKAERQRIAEACANRSRAEAAEALGLSVATLQRRLAFYGLADRRPSMPKMARAIGAASDGRPSKPSSTSDRARAGVRA